MLSESKLYAICSSTQAGLGQLSIEDFSVVTPYIPDSPPKLELALPLFILLVECGIAYCSGAGQIFDLLRFFSNLKFCHLNREVALNSKANFLITIQCSQHPAGSECIMWM